MGASGANTSAVSRTSVRNRPSAAGRSVTWSFLITVAMCRRTVTGGAGVAQRAVGLADAHVQHLVAVGQVRFLADVGRLIGRAAEAPERGPRGPVADGGVPDEAGGRVFGRFSRRVSEEQRLGGGIQPQLVHLEISEPARPLVGIGPEYADIHLVQIGAAHVHAHRQRRGGENAVHRLHFLEDLRQRRLDLGGRGNVGNGEVAPLAVDGHAPQQRGMGGPLAGGARQHVVDQPPRVGGLVMLQRVGQQPYPRRALGGDPIGAEAVEFGQVAPRAAHHEAAPRLELAPRRTGMAGAGIGRRVARPGLDARPGIGGQSNRPGVGGQSSRPGSGVPASVKAGRIVLHGAPSWRVGPAF